MTPDLFLFLLWYFLGAMEMKIGPYKNKPKD